LCYVAEFCELFSGDFTVIRFNDACKYSEQSGFS